MVAHSQPATEVDLPARFWLPHEHFAHDYHVRARTGVEWLRRSTIAVVGLARNCGPALRLNLERIMPICKLAKAWSLHIEANDCDDDTLEVLSQMARDDSRATFHYQTLGDAKFGHEFAGRRTDAMARHRTACQRWVRSSAPDASLVIVVDWDLWGGFSEDGLCHGLGWLLEMPGAFGLASVSLFQYDFGAGPQWAHYDLWALRGLGQPDCYWDTYQNGYGGFGYGWLPAIGTPPAVVASAFGGMAIYRAADYLAGKYSGDDCEHVPFHRSIRNVTGKHLYVCPGMRTLAMWL